MLTARVCSKESLEFFAVLFFLFCYFIFPFVGEEYYPFFNPHLFVDAPKVFSKYHLEDQNQKSLALEEFGLGSYYWGLNGYYPGRPSQHFAARKNPATINLFGEVQSKEGVESEVLKHLSEPGHRKIKFVDVTQTIFGARSEDSAGVSEVRKWRIYNPHL